MAQSIYNFIIHLIQTFLYALPIKNKKFQKWKEGQKNIFSSLNDPGATKPIWIHVASSGEFEQAKPVIDLLHELGETIILSFFSPSGFEAKKNYEKVKKVVYLPIDTRRNASKFIELIQPKLAIFVKYEFWLNYMLELNRRKIPTVLISGVFRKNHFLFQWYGKLHLKEFRKFKYISVQDQSSKEILRQHKIDSVITGDTRIDRSLELPETEFSNQKVEHFLAGDKAIIIGSAWPEDIQLFEKIDSFLLSESFKLIIAPHELEQSFILEIQETFKGVLLSNYDYSLQSKTLIIDEIGVLKYIYRYGKIAYIGGGFGKGIHNTLEPASYGIPVVFGPKYQKFIEANQMLFQQAAFTVSNSQELKDILEKLLKNHQWAKSGENAKRFLLEHQGASEKILSKIQNLI